MVGALGNSACPSCSSSADQPSASSNGPTRKRAQNGMTNRCNHCGASQGVKGILTRSLKLSRKTFVVYVGELSGGQRAGSKEFQKSPVAGDQRAVGIEVGSERKVPDDTDFTAGDLGNGGGSPG